jgi:hypothetical protein
MTLKAEIVLVMVIMILSGIGLTIYLIAKG